MELANPIWLWGLTGLSVPIAIHLLSRREGKIIKVGSLRHLDDVHTKQSINLRLNEVLLLIIRCFLITLIVLLLGGISIDFFRTKNNRWVIVEDGLTHDPEIKSIVDSLEKDGFQLKSMAKGFPDLSTSGSDAFSNYWQMLESLRTKSVDESVVISHSFSKGFRGKRPRMPDNLTWITKDPATKEFLFKAVKYSTDSVSVRLGNSSAKETSFSNLTQNINPQQDYFSERPGLDSVEITAPDTLAVAIFADPEFEYDKNIIVASLNAIENTIPVVFDIQISRPSQLNTKATSDWNVWLSNDTLPKTFTNNFIIFSEDITKNAHLLEKAPGQSEGHSTWHITRRLNEAGALDDDLPLTLVSILLHKKDDDIRASVFDRRTQPGPLLWSTEENGNVHRAAFSDINTNTAQYLAMLVLALLLFERILAFKRTA